MSSAAGVSVAWFVVLPLPDLAPRDPGLFEGLRTTHFLLSRALIALVTLHIAAVLHHDVLRRDGIFRRMWPSGRT
jgi:cytochrome b561